MNDLTQILVVDDNEMILQGLRHLLEARGYQVSIANSGEVALNILGKSRYDLVLTDLQMPGMDGLELLQHIKQQSPATPVVMITAYAVAENVIQALRGGVSDFIPKPYKAEELLVIVAREAARGRQARQAESAQAPVPFLSDTAAPAMIGRQLSPRQLDQIDRLLADLRIETLARCILLVESSGHIIDAKGVIEDINVSALAALVAGDFAATAGIASLIGEGDAFRLNYHEGARFSIYLAHLTTDVFMLIVFGQEVKSGLVLYATRQVLPEIQSILEAAAPQAGAEVHIQDFGEQLFSLDQLTDEGMLNDDVLKSLDDQFKNLWK